MLGAFALAGLLSSACTSLAPEPAKSSTLAGDWALDPTASGDFDAAVNRMLAQHREKMRRERSEHEFSPEGDESAAPNEREQRVMRVPEEPAERVRSRLDEALRPPTRLLVELGPGTVSLKANDEPAHILYPGQRVGRIDTGGSARLETGWSGPVFVVEQRYVSGATRVQRYTPQDGNLLVELKYTDPYSGALELRSLYRRQ